MLQPEPAMNALSTAPGKPETSVASATRDRLRRVSDPTFRVTVHVRSGVEAGHFQTLGPGRHIVGRDPNAAIRLDGEDVSRQHAMFVIADGQVTLADLDSKNGIFMRQGGKTQRISGETVVADHAEFEIADVTLEVRYPRALVEEALQRGGEPTLTRIQRAKPHAARSDVLVPLVATAVFTAAIVGMLWWR